MDNYQGYFFVGEVSPYVSTPRCARVCHYPLRGDTPRRPVEFLAKPDFAPAPRGELRGVLPPALGVAWDRPKTSQKFAFCAAVERLARTLRKILQILAKFKGSPRVGGSAPKRLFLPFPLVVNF